jgi:hypothetical protein
MVEFHRLSHRGETRGGELPRVFKGLEAGGNGLPIAFFRRGAKYETFAFIPCDGGFDGADRYVCENNEDAA